MLRPRIREIRKTLNYHQSDVAKELDVSRVAVSMWERGLVTPNAERAIKLAQFLNCSVSDLYEEVS